MNPTLGAKPTQHHQGSVPSPAASVALKSGVRPSLLIVSLYALLYFTQRSLSSFTLGLPLHSHLPLPALVSLHAPSERDTILSGSPAPPRRWPRHGYSSWAGSAQSHFHDILEVRSLAKTETTPSAVSSNLSSTALAVNLRPWFGSSVTIACLHLRRIAEEEILPSAQKSAGKENHREGTCKVCCLGGDC